MITLRDVALTYSSGQGDYAILKNLSMNVQKGEWVSLIGPSGSGKTSLLKILGGMLSPTEGEVYIGEKEIYQLVEKDRHHFLREHTSFVYQQFRLLPQFTVLDNVMLPLVPYEHKGELKKRAMEMIDKVGLAHRTEHYPWQLSGGEQQRTAFARALLTKPTLLLCDEPTGNLDRVNRDRLLDLMKEIHREGQTIVLVTHDEVVANYGERILMLKEGEMKEKVLHDE